ncbi:MAG: polysulfide reductase NrfD [Caldilineaceae bacterium]|nr:polysulfide reductase NrfD [Caldilineaceae bacterium]HRJ41339.1 polysulfide reductase NrfD [Caldilineaceae bacterium]
MTVHTPSLQQGFQIGPYQKGDIIAGILGFLTMIGLAAGIGRLLAGMGATTALTDSYPWGIWIGFDFALIAFSGVGFTIAAVVHVLHLHQFQPVLRPAILAGLLGYVAVLMLLLLDLGRPDRFYNFLLFYNMHSPLFEICWCVLLYTTVLLLEVSPDLLAFLPWKWPLRLVYRLMTPVTIIGITLSTLHQSTLGTLYLNMPHRLHPLWYTPILPLLFYISSILAGLSLGIIAYKIAMGVRGQKENPSVVMGLGKDVVAVALLYWFLRVGEVIYAGELPMLLALTPLSQLWLGELLFCAVIPIVLWGMPPLRRQPWAQWVAPLAAILGLGMNRFNATLAAQLVATDTVYVPNVLEWLSTIGIIAMAMLLWYLGVRFVMGSALKLGYEHR